MLSTVRADGSALPLREFNGPGCMDVEGKAGRRLGGVQDGRVPRSAGSGSVGHHRWAPAEPGVKHAHTTPGIPSPSVLKRQQVSV